MTVSGCGGDRSGGNIIAPSVTAHSFSLANRCSVNEATSDNWAVLSQATASATNQPLAATIKTAPLKGVASISGELVSYTPDLESEIPGEDSFAITISSGEKSIDVLVTLGTYFSINSACTTDTSGLNNIIQHLPSNLEVVLSLGHASEGEQCLQLLSEARAGAVKSYLIKKGIEANRLYTEGKAAKVPSTSGGGNGRTEVTVLGWDSAGIRQTLSTSVNFSANVQKICD